MFKTFRMLSKESINSSAIGSITLKGNKKRSIWASKKEGKINHEAPIGGALWGLIYMFAFVPSTTDHFLTIIGFYG